MEKFDLKGSGVDRPSGSHVTNILRFIQRSLGTMKTADDWDLPAAGEAGFIWEDVFTEAFGKRQSESIVHINAVQKDGIWLSPDGISPDPGLIYTDDHGDEQVIPPSD
jgi:hypothetical protein